MRANVSAVAVAMATILAIFIARPVQTQSTEGAALTGTVTITSDNTILATNNTYGRA